MKRVILIVSVLFLLVVISVSSVFYLKNYKNYLINSLETAVLNGSEELVYEVYESWEDKKDILGIFIKEERIMKISDAIFDSAIYFDTKRIKKAVYLIEELYQSELPTLSNVL